MRCRRRSSFLTPAAGLIVLLASPFAVWADEAEHLLSNYINNINTLEANFNQVSIDGQGNLIERASGRFFLQRPDKFRWDYQAPYRQVIVTDGETLWVYDEDLEQVMVRKKPFLTEDTPMAVLTDYETIQKYFVVTDLGKVEGYDWIKLIPRKNDSQYHSFRVAFEQGRLGMLVMSDNLGQITRIDFSRKANNHVIEEGIFRFEPPAGVDIIRH